MVENLVSVCGFPFAVLLAEISILHTEMKMVII